MFMTVSPAVPGKHQAVGRAVAAVQMVAFSIIEQNIYSRLSAAPVSLKEERAHQGMGRGLRSGGKQGSRGIPGAKRVRVGKNACSGFWGKMFSHRVPDTVERTSSAFKRTVPEHLGRIPSAPQPGGDVSSAGNY